LCSEAGPRLGHGAATLGGEAGARRAAMLRVCGVAGSRFEFEEQGYELL